MRTMSPNMAALTTDSAVNPFILAEAEFASGTVRLWNGHGPLSWDGEQWLGGGTLLELSSVEETASTSAAGVKISLSGIPSDMLALALGEHYQGRRVRLWLGAMDDAGQIVADPIPLFAGRMDVMNIDEGAETSTIVMSAENQLIDLKRADDLRYTDAAQKALYPGDRGLEFVAALQDRELIWGRAS